MSAAAAPPLYSVLPFVAMLFTIALCPLWVSHWWESNERFGVGVLCI
jgi:hypothetical protein